MRNTAFITGADYNHTGYAIASKFAQNGFDVVITCIDSETVAEAAEHLKKEYDVNVYPYVLDLRNAEQAENIFKSLDEKGIFVSKLCLNAADLALGPDPARGTPFFEVTPEYVEYILQANVVGNYRIVHLAAERMKENGGGAVVFMSTNSVQRPNMHRVPYITAKGAINAMSKSMAVDLGKYGIRSNVIMPGTIKTSRWVAMGDKQITNGSMVPIGDISDFEDIANAAYFLCSDMAKNITGTELIVDGGMSAQIFPEKLNEYRAKEIEGKILD